MSEIADFRSIFARIAPQPQHPAKKVQLTLIRSPLRAFQRAQDEPTVVPKPPKGAQIPKVSKITAITPKRYE